MPDARATPAQEAVDIGAMLHALAFLLDDDAPLPAVSRMGVALVLRHLAERADALWSDLEDLRPAA
jgi:hypothetical protein